MNTVMKIKNRVSQYGFNYVFHIIVKNKIYRPLDCLIISIVKILLKDKQLKNTIIIESHNDFDANGGAFYDFLIKHKINENYKIVWLIKNKAPKKLPSNVECFNIFRPSFRKTYHICTAKIFTADDIVTDKVRDDQISLYLGHGGGIGFKNVKLTLSPSVDFALFSSDEMAKMIAPYYGLAYPSNKIKILGFPEQDAFYKPSNSFLEIEKIAGDRKYSKIIIWMPTFRRGGGSWRCDSLSTNPLGIPLFKSLEEYSDLNEFLVKKNILLIIKIHPMQWLGDLSVHNKTNIRILTKDDMKHLGIDNYRMLACSDGLISDFSSVSIEYFHMHKPIAYVYEDLDNYTNLVEDTKKLAIGDKIYTIDDMVLFIKNIDKGIDSFERERETIFNITHKYHDGNSCERLADFLGLV